MSIQPKLCEIIVTGAESVEAAFTISTSGLPLSWYSRKGATIDEIASISAGLVGIARELHLFDTKSEAAMTFETEFGAMYLRTLDSESLLVLCLLKGYSFLTIHRLLREVLSTV